VRAGDETVREEADRRDIRAAFEVAMSTAILGS
jgi:hypothetical protein